MVRAIASMLLPSETEDVAASPLVAGTNPTRGRRNVGDGSHDSGRASRPFPRALIRMIRGVNPTFSLALLVFLAVNFERLKFSYFATTLLKMATHSCSVHANRVLRSSRTGSSLASRSSQPLAASRSLKTKLHQACWPSAISGDGNGGDPRVVIELGRKFARVGQKNPLATLANMADLAESIKTGPV